MRATEFVTELFEPGKKNWQWKFRGSEEAAATFHAGDREYIWQALRATAKSKAWEIQFRLIRNPDQDPDNLDLFGTTGTGNSPEVFSTAVDITRAFLQEYGLDQVEEIFFNAKEDSRIGLYARMIKRLLPNWDLYSRKTEHYGMEFYLTDRRAYDKPENKIAEAPLADYVPVGDFNKPGPFRGVDKRLVPHPTNQLKTQQFFEQTPYDFRLFFSNIPGTGRYSEYGEMDPKTVSIIFGDNGVADQILNGHEDAITIVFVGNKGDSKVMLTPWMMAHRIGHAIQATGRMRQSEGPWKAAEDHFFRAINGLLDEFYGRRGNPGGQLKRELTKEYNALFNAIGTQRSSRTGQITRPYEFLYELFAQYLGTGKITLKPLPKQQGYGRKAWGRSTQSLNLRGDEQESQYTTEVLARDMEIMFSDVLGELVGKILVM